jgi:hypothetical protein
MSVLRLFLLLVLMITLGCGDGRMKLPTAPVEGTVTYRGKPLGAGRVIFVHDSGQAVATDLAAGGSFKLTAFQGKNRVAVQCFWVKQDAPSMLKGSPGKGPAGKSPAATSVPERYTEHTTSGLMFEVKPDANGKAEFALKD